VVEQPHCYAQFFPSHQNISQNSDINHVTIHHLGTVALLDLKLDPTEEAKQGVDTTVSVFEIDNYYP